MSQIDYRKRSPYVPPVYKDFQPSGQLVTPEAVPEAAPEVLLSVPAQSTMSDGPELGIGGQILDEVVSPAQGRIAATESSVE